MRYCHDLGWEGKGGGGGNGQLVGDSYFTISVNL